MTNDLIGKRLGKYEIQAQIGKGGMGVVYQGYDPLLDRRVAIKVLAPHLVWEPDFIERFLREARLAARLKHTAIVAIYEIGQEGSWYYIVMEYLDGPTLATYVRQHGPLSPADVIAILQPLADALDYAHRHGLVHRDIKPGNIVIDRSGQVTLTDFGIARAAQDTRLTMAGTIMGTPEYMSPEQAWGEEVSSPTDLYSLAVVAYEMLCGRVPFSGTTPHAVLYKQIHEPPPPIREVRPDLPAGVETALEKALAKEPAKRYPTVKAFVDTLEQALAGRMEAVPVETTAQGGRAREATPPPRQPAPGRRTVVRPATTRRKVPRWIWLLAGLAVLLIATGLVLLGLSGGDGRTPAPLLNSIQSTATLPAQTTSQPTASIPSLPTAGHPQPVCNDPLGCVEIKKDEPIRIGYLLVLSGPEQALGIDSRRSLEMAAEQQGQILGHEIEILGEDSKCNPDGGQMAATVLAAVPKLVAIVGTTCTESARAAIPVICQANIPMISPSNTGPDLTGPDRPASYHCYLRTAQNDLVQGRAAAEFARDVGITRAATIHDGSPYALMLQEVFSVEFEQLGGEITIQQVVGPDGAEVAPALERIAATESGLIYYPLFAEAGTQVTRQAREHPALKGVMLMGADGMFTPEFLESAGEAALGMLLSSADLTVLGPKYEEFFLRYRDKYGEPPIGPFHAHAFDAAMMIFAAIDRVGIQRDDGALFIGRRALVDALFTTRDFKGLTGSLSCNRFGDCADPRIAVYEIVNGNPASWNPGAGPGSNPRKIWPETR